MSSTLGLECAYHPLGQPHQLPSTEGPGESPVLNHNVGWKEEHVWQRVFRNGLPTPPNSKAMTRVTLKNHYNNGVHPPSQDFPRSSHQDAIYGEHNTTDSILAGPEQGRLSYNKDSQRHTTSSSRDFGFDTKKSSGNTIASNFRIPESVNSSGGSIAEFAAEITCLFWFESATTLRRAEEIVDASFVDRGLVPDATPSTGFRKWVTTILTTTLVSKNVILLALLFVYRLKYFNPGVSGKRGSEFRLFTIALMLGNKFLDDNTYTNKTWAEVSGISVTEIHIMEVEFLSNMRYNLYVSESEWGRWKVKLGKFGAFFEAASKIPYTNTSPVTPLAQSFPVKIPSPPSTHHSTHSYPQLGPAPESYPSLPNPYSTAPPLHPAPVRDVHPEHRSRKRSLDPTSEVPPAKRMFHSELSSSRSSAMPTPEAMIYTPGTLAAYTPGSDVSKPYPTEAVPAEHKTLARLPMPRIQTWASQIVDTTSSQLAPLSLPTQLPPQRAMATVYPTSSNSWSQQNTPATTVGPFSDMNLYSNPIPTLGNISRNASALPSATASPSTPYNTATPTRPGLSPSYFLRNRSSPYRPVRNVNTLLIPPPPASLNNASRNIAYDQMHYQPLSKNSTERRVGVVPYLHHDAWSHIHSGKPAVPFQYDLRT